MRRLFVLFAVAVMPALPVVAQAQTDPYSGSTTTVAPAEPYFTVNAYGLTVTFSAGHVAGVCTWDFGDGTTGDGNPVVRTYAADGDYTITAVCGDDTIVRSLTFAAGLAYTGFGVVPFGIGIAALVLLAVGALVVSRRLRENR